MRGSFQKRILIALLVVVTLILFTGCKSQDMQAITGGVIQEFGKTSDNVAADPPLKQKPYVTCVDSDAGDEPSLPGTVTLRSDGNSVESQDTCTGDAELMEHYCDGDKEKMRGYNCKYGCREGRCLTSSEEKGNIDPTLAKQGATTEQNVATPGVKEEEKEPVPKEQPEQEYNPEPVEEKIQGNKEAAEQAREEVTQEVQTQFYNCFNGFKDSFETDIDCGGACGVKCGYNRGCEENKDCAKGLRCNSRMRKCTQGGY
jgi:hypothetical protein